MWIALGKKKEPVHKVDVYSHWLLPETGGLWLIPTGDLAAGLLHVAWHTLTLGLAKVAHEVQSIFLSSVVWRQKKNGETFLEAQKYFVFGLNL